MCYRNTSYGETTFDRYFFEKDLFGNIVAVYSETGTKVASYCYDAWGNCTVLTNVNGIGAMNPFRYRGYYLDTETNLYYLQSRYYDSYTGRFINADGQLNGGLLGYNLFAYCENNPVMYVDPTGEFFISITLLCVAAFAIAGAVAGGVTGYYGAKSAGVDEDEIWKYTVGGALIGGIIGGVAGYAAAPIISAATGIAGLSVSSAGITIIGTGGVGAGQVVEGVYYQVTSHQAAQSIAQTQTLIPSASEQSVCVLNFQPTLEQAKLLGAKAYDTVIQFRTNCTTFIPDTTVPFEGAYRNMRDGVVKIFEVIEVGFR